MWNYAAALALVFGLLCFVSYIRRRTRAKPRTPHAYLDDDDSFNTTQLSIPGPAKSDPITGNLGDVSKHGSLHLYLAWLHATYGDLAAFWWGDKHVVSLGSPELLRHSEKLFDRPGFMFNLFKPLFGEESIQYANRDMGKHRRKDIIDVAFKHATVKGLYDGFKTVANDLIIEWSLAAGQRKQLPLREEMLSFTLRGLCLTSFGPMFQSRSETTRLKDAYDTAWHDMEQRIDGSSPAPGSDRERIFNAAIGYMQTKARQCLAERSADRQGLAAPCFMDYLVQDSIASDQMRVCDAVTTLVGGFHTTGNLLTWVLIFLARHPVVLARLRDELVRVLGTRTIIEFDEIAQLRYMRQVLDESLRLSALAPWAARYAEYEMTIRDHVIPPRTPLLHPLGVIMHSPAWWPDPFRFDPDRFEPDAARTRPRLAFPPFGFAGQRKCPGFDYAYTEATIFLVAIIQSFDLTLARPEASIAPRHGLVTSPAEEVYIYVATR